MAFLLRYHHADLNAKVQAESGRAALLQTEHSCLKAGQRKALEEAEKELCESTLEEEGLLDLQNE